MPVVHWDSTQENKARNQVRSLDEYIRRHMWVKDLSPMDARIGGTSTALYGAPVVVIAEATAGNQDAVWGFPRPSLWRSGTFKMTLWYSVANFLDAGNLRWQLRLNSYELDGPGSNNLITQQTVVQTHGTSANFDLAAITIEDATPRTNLSDFPMLHARVRVNTGDAADTYAADRYIHGVRIEYRPDRNQ